MEKKYRKELEIENAAGSRKKEVRLTNLKKNDGQGGTGKVTCMYLRGGAFLIAKRQFFYSRKFCSLLFSTVPGLQRILFAMEVPFI